MRIQPITSITMSVYANRDQAIRNVCYYVERHGDYWFPVVYGKMRDQYESPWLAMQAAKEMADKIAGSMRSRGIRARAVQLHNAPIWG